MARMADRTMIADAAGFSDGAEALKRLRESVRPLHERVDARFSRFDLKNPPDYAAFLRAHAGVLARIEPALHADAALPAWQPRMHLVEADLSALAGMGVTRPDVRFADERENADGSLAGLLAAHGGRLGAVYVLEGSRLGGKFLATQLAQTGLPRAYLAAEHPKGGWQAFLAALRGALAREADGGDLACRGAAAVFEAYMVGA